MRDEFDCVVIGAGVVGLAVARALARAGQGVLILERHRAFGTETSSRNSEVIHAGIYYPRHSAKARLCVAGKHRLYRFCEEREIPHRRCGKLIVATSDAQLSTLQALAVQARENGVSDLEWLDRPGAAGLEPCVSAAGALFSPSSGIVDSHALMLDLLGDAEAHGALIACDSHCLGGRVAPPGFVLEVGETRDEVAARRLVNCGGLGASDVARRIAGLPPACAPALHLAKGNYGTLVRRSPFSHLVYPLPEPGGLGVHVTLDLAGRARFGPDVEWVDTIDYSVSEARIEGFYAAIRRYWPEIADGDLQPAYAGIRPKLSGPGEPPADFLLQGPAQHGVRGFVNLLGIESPGLTASLAIADEVTGLLGVSAPVPAS